MDTPQKQLLIGFKDLKVLKLELKFSGLNNNNELNAVIGFDPVFVEGADRRDFAIKFNVKLNNRDNSFVMEITALASFGTSEIITEEFKTSNWVRVNAPAIGFPYLRAYITTVTTHSGVNPIVLPAFNFTNVVKPSASTSS